jgi:hypothetical protein
VDFPDNLKIYKKIVSEKLIFKTILLVENVKLTKTPFLGANCVAELEIGGKIFRKI